MSKKALLCGTALLCGLSIPALAKYCVKLPSCEELGYIFPYKEGRRSIRCPFDTSKVLYLDYCQAYGLSSKPSDEAGDYQECVEEKADGTKINTGYYRYTRCNAGYSYKSGTCTHSCSYDKAYPLDTPPEHCKTPTASKVFDGETCYSATCNTCEDGYDMDSSGSCWNCQLNESGPAYGLYLCGEGKTGNTLKKSVTCADKNFYEECLIVETCFNEYQPVSTSQCSTGIIRSYLNDSNEYVQSCNTSAGYEINQSSACIRSSDGQKYYDVQACTSGTCSGHELCINDEGADGETACECGGNKYFKNCKETCLYEYRADDSCASGIKHSHQFSGDNYFYEWCDTGNELDTTQDSCVRADGKTYYESVKSCVVNKGKCEGMLSCSAGGADGATSCECGGNTYYSACKEVTKTCDSGYTKDSSCDSGIKYLSETSSGWCYTTKGYELYEDSSTCTRPSDNKTLYSYPRGCTTSGATCAGKKRCAYPDPGSLCNCGGYLYSNNCLVQCNYEETPETCAAKGKSFSIRCLTDTAQYGECVES